MRKEKRVRVIASKPVLDSDFPQDGVESIIGNVYEVTQGNPSDGGTIAVHCPEFGGIIRLNPGEFEVVEGV